MSVGAFPAWQLLSVVVTIAAVAGAVAVAVALRATMRRDFFFMVLLGTTVVYLQLAPTAALLRGNLLPFAALDPLSPALFPAEYVRLQFLCLVLFQAPLVALYILGVRLRHTRRRAVLAVRPESVRRLSFLSIILAVVFLVALYRNDYLFNRIGTEGIGAKILTLPIVDYVTIRTYQTVGLVVVGVLQAARVLGTSAHGRLLNIAFAVNVATYGLYAVVNSRALAILVGLTLVGVTLAFGGRGPRIPVRRMVRLAAVMLLAYYGAIVAVNVRSSFQGDFALQASQFTDLSGDVLADASWRLNCIDLMAQLQGPVESEGPALGAAWTSAKWYALRFVDRKGFDAFRASLNTSSKTWLMARYLNLQIADYPSCTMTDLYGNFDFVGMLAAAGVFGFLLIFWARQVDRVRSGGWMIVAIFVVTRATLFDQEASSLLFAWVQQLPLVLALVWLRPFTTYAVRGGDDRESPARESVGRMS